MLLTCSCRTVLVQMMSAAGTGYFFNTKRNRLTEKLVLRKHDPVGKMCPISCVRAKDDTYTWKPSINMYCSKRNKVMTNPSNLLTVNFSREAQYLVS